MNIFITSNDPRECAEYLDDKRVVKMVLETAQMLSTAVRSVGIDAGYKATHANHPCNQWVRESKQNFHWLYLHGIALADEYHTRYGKQHKSFPLIVELGQYANKFPSKGLTKFANCAANKQLGINYKDMQDVTVAYQLYLNDRWDNDKRKPTWSGRG